MYMLGSFMCIIMRQRSGHADEQTHSHDGWIYFYSHSLSRSRSLFITRSLSHSCPGFGLRNPRARMRGLYVCLHRPRSRTLVGNMHTHRNSFGYVRLAVDRSSVVVVCMLCTSIVCFWNLCVCFRIANIPRRCPCGYGSLSLLSAIAKLKSMFFDCFYRDASRFIASIQNANARLFDLCRCIYYKCRTSERKCVEIAHESIHSYVMKYEWGEWRVETLMCLFLCLTCSTTLARTVSRTKGQ